MISRAQIRRIISRRAWNYAQQYYQQDHEIRAHASVKMPITLMETVLRKGDSPTQETDAIRKLPTAALRGGRQAN